MIYFFALLEIKNKKKKRSLLELLRRKTCGLENQFSIIFQKRYKNLKITKII